MSSAERKFTAFIARLIEDYDLKDWGHVYDAIEEAWMYYDTAIETAAEVNAAPPSSLHEIADPLRQVIRLLARRANRLRAMEALDGEKDGAIQHKELLRTLMHLRRNLPPPPAKKSKGRPSKSTEWRGLVQLLADLWEKERGKPFRQRWVKNPNKGRDAGRWKPANDAAEFVHDVVAYFDHRVLRDPAIVDEIRLWNRKRKSSAKR